MFRPLLVALVATAAAACYTSPVYSYPDPLPPPPPPPAPVTATPAPPPGNTTIVIEGNGQPMNAAPAPQYGYAQPVAAQACTAQFYGEHPVPYEYGGGWCVIEGPHCHEYLPTMTDQYVYQNNAYYFGADVEFAFEGGHPIPAEFGGGWCGIPGVHQHRYRPTHDYGWDQGRGVYVYRPNAVPTYGAGQRPQPSYPSGGYAQPTYPNNGGTYRPTPTNGTTTATYPQPNYPHANGTAQPTYPQAQPTYPQAQPSYPQAQPSYPQGSHPIPYGNDVQQGHPTPTTPAPQQPPMHTWNPQPATPVTAQPVPQPVQPNGAHPIPYGNDVQTHVVSNPADPIRPVPPAPLPNHPQPASPPPSGGPEVIHFDQHPVQQREPTVVFDANEQHPPVERPYQPPTPHPVTPAEAASRGNVQPAFGGVHMMQPAVVNPQLREMEQQRAPAAAPGQQKKNQNRPSPAVPGR